MHTTLGRRVRGLRAPPGNPGDVWEQVPHRLRGLGLIREPRFGLAGVQPTYGDQAEPKVADFSQQSVQRGLVGDQAAEDRLLALPADLQAAEPCGPPAVQDTRHADLIPGRAAGAHSGPSQRPAGAAELLCPAVRFAPAATECGFLAGHGRA